MQETGVFICSSDNRRDVLDRVIPSVFKFWRDCPYPIYVGLNSSPDGLPDVIPVLAPVSDWRNELAFQLRQIPQKRVILFLDDFLIEALVRQQRVNELLTAFGNKRLSYLRMLPLGRSLRERIGHLSRQSQEDIVLISKTRPFYASLQVAIWAKEFFFRGIANH